MSLIKTIKVRYCWIKKKEDPVANEQDILT